MYLSVSVPPRMSTTNNVVLSCTPWIGNQEKYIQRKMRQQSGHSALKTMYRHSPQTDEKLQLILECSQFTHLTILWHIMLCQSSDMNDCKVIYIYDNIQTYLHL